MKQWTPILLVLMVGILLLSACRKEAPINLAPPLFGFGDTVSTLAITGDTLEVVIYLTKPLSTTTELLVAYGGPARLGEDYTVVGDGSVLRVPAGATEARLLITALPSTDPERLDRYIELALQPVQGLRLQPQWAMRRINFGLKHTVNLAIWAKDELFPKFWGYTSFGPDPVPGGSSSVADGEHFAFVYASRTQPNVLGMYNPQVGRSTNALNLHRIYADYNVSSGSANIRMPELLRFIPASPGAKVGRVEVIPQRVTIVRTASSGLPPFTIGLSGEGTYSEITGSIVLAIYFDETEIGGGEQVLRRYVYERDERP